MNNTITITNKDISVADDRVKVNKSGLYVNNQ